MNATHGSTHDVFSKSGWVSLVLLAVLHLSASPSLAQAVEMPLNSALKSFKHVEGETADKVTAKVTITNISDAAIPTDLIHADLYISNDEILDADDDMLAQKTLATQLTETAEKKGRDVTTVALEPGQAETIKLKAKDLSAVQGMFAILNIGMSDREGSTTLVQQIGQAGCAKHTLFLDESEPNDDQAPKRSKIKLGQCLTITGEMEGSDLVDRFFTVPAGEDEQQLSVTFDSEAMFTLSVDLLSADIILESCTDTLECNVIISEAVDRIDLTVRPEDESQAGHYTIDIRSVAVQAPAPAELHTGPGNVVMNEIFPEASQVELHNRGSEPVDISGFWLCHTTPDPFYIQMPSGTVIEPGGFVIVHWGIDGANVANEVFTFPNIPIPMNIPRGEFALYTAFVPAPNAKNFADSALMVDYMQWGAAEHLRENVAVEANIWPSGRFVPTQNSGQSLSLNGNGDTPEDWSSTAPSIGSEN